MAIFEVNEPNYTLKNKIFKLTFYLYFFQWRKFNFFDLKENVDNGKIAETIKVNIKLLFKLIFV